MTAFLKLYAVSFVAFPALDAVWLGLVARNFYRVQMGDLLRSDPRWRAAGLFYALFGLITYATYDLTNLAVLRGSPTLVAVV